MRARMFSLLLVVAMLTSVARAQTAPDAKKEAVVAEDKISSTSHSVGSL